MVVSWPTAFDLMTSHPVTLPHDAQLSQALGLMRTRSFHELPVLKKTRLIGMITFESIARRTNLPLTTKVEHLMLLPPIVTASTSYPELAEQLLAAGLRAAPVVGKRGELLGVVSRTDLVRAFPNLAPLARHTVDEISSPLGLLVKETDRCGLLISQIRLLEEHALPVIDRKGRLVGAVGVADLGRVLWGPVLRGKKDAPRHGSVYDILVGTIMNSPAITVPTGTTAGEAARLMSHEKVSSVFVVEDGKPTGVVSQVDLLGLAVGGAEPPGGSRLGDVYVQITGLRGSGDPTMLAEIDRVVAKGLRHISRHARPTLLSLHFSPHSTHRSGDATVEARLHSDQGIFYASNTGWNFFASISTLMDELSQQTRRSHEDRRRRRRISTKSVPPEATVGDAELEARIRAATEGDNE